jgi:hypothetical protein
MAAATPQSLSNHARYVPGYHFVLSGILSLILVWATINFVRFPGVATLVGVLMAIGFVLMGWYLREFALKVQDRIIRLEERLRMTALLPPDLQPRIPEFTTRQLVALRFASDPELPGLARRVLEEQITQAAEIKKFILEWRADELRV